MTHFHQTDEIAVNEILPGFAGRFIHTAELTVGHFQIKAGSILPEHHHPQEQISNLIAGRFEMTVNGETKVCEAGGVVTIPPNAVHSGRALTDCYIIDVFRPAREDYK
ncbi:MAG: cupin domain-containing protein [Bacteroidota bacterium]